LLFISIYIFQTNNEIIIYIYIYTQTVFFKFEAQLFKKEPYKYMHL